MTNEKWGLKEKARG